MSHVCDGRDRSCAVCKALARRLDTVRAVMTVDDELDDIKRARLWTQLEDRLTSAEPLRRSRRPLALAVGVVAAAIAAFALVPRRDPARHILAVPVDTVVSSRLGAHTAASIVGPARLEILGVAGDATAIRLHSGTLLAEFAGDAGRSLRIETPGATIDVVGTLFAIAVQDGATCTSVAHGRVRITTRRDVLHVIDGQRHCTGDSIRPITDDMRDALARQAARPEVAEATRSAATAPAGRADAHQPTRPPEAAAPRRSAEPAGVPAVAVPSSSVAAEASAPDLEINRAASPAPAPARSPTAAQESRPPISSTSAPGHSPTAPASLSERVPGASSGSSTEPLSTAPSGSSTEQSPAAPSTRPPEPRPAISSTSSPAPAAEPPAARLTAEELYRAAEAALAARDAVAAERALAALVASHPGSQLVDQALYERARIAYEQRAWPAARSQLVRLAAIPGSRLAEPGHYLRCRIAVESREPSAAACLAAYRATFPQAPHDLDALAMLVQLAHARAGCAGAAKLVDELAQRYPRTTFAAAWRSRCPEPP
jgi:hypothetical protein